MTTYRVQFICTGQRGGEPQHTRRKVGGASMTSDGWVVTRSHASWGGEGGRVRCPRCGRNLKLTPEQWTVLMRGLQDSGRTDPVDISHMPC